MATKLFGNSQCEFNLSGIKKLYVANGIDYPLDYFLTGTTVNSSLVTRILANLSWYEVKTVDNIIYEENFIEERAGKYYELTMNMTLPIINQLVNNLFGLTDGFEQVSGIKSGNTITDQRLFTKDCTFVFLDNNDNWYVSGYEKGFTLETLDLETEGQTYNAVMVCRSYSRARLISKTWVIDTIINNIPPIPPPQPQPPLVPSEVPNLLHWYGDTVNANNVNRNTLSNGASIVTWNDQAAAGINWYTQVGSSFPAPSPTYLSSTNAIRFDGINQALRTDIRVGFTGGTIFWVATINRTKANAYQTGGVWQNGESGSVGNKVDFISRFDVSSVQQGLEFFNAQSVRRSYGTSVALGTNPHIFSYSYLAGSTIDFHLDGDFITSGNTPTNIDEVTTRYRMLGAARRQPAVVSSDFDAYEMIIYNRKLTDIERGGIESYLNNKYSIF